MLRERGGDKFSLNELARRIGVSPASAYRHFASKDALLAAVCSEGYRELSTALLCPFPASFDAGQRVIELGIRYVQFSVDNGDVFSMMFGSHPLDSETVGTDTFVPLLEAVAEAQKTGHMVPGDAREAAVAVWIALHGMAVLSLSGGLRGLGIERSPQELVRGTFRRLLPELAPE
ncbi:TetR family transcriptional regulator [Kineosporia sp. NBRC 101731]|nr:TetR family transcriptional regulator [Kineosporia sp. NBRC 101731]